MVLSDGGVSPAEVVKHVSRLVSSIESMARFPELLGDIDIDRFAFLTRVGLPDGSCSGLLQSLLLFFSIIMKVKQHEEFFPAFHALVTGILQTLGKFNQLYLFYLQMTSW